MGHAHAAPCVKGISSRSVGSCYERNIRRFCLFFSCKTEPSNTFNTCNTFSPSQLDRLPDFSQSSLCFISQGALQQEQHLPAGCWRNWVSSVGIQCLTALLTVLSATSRCCQSLQKRYRKSQAVQGAEPVPCSASPRTPRWIFSSQWEFSCLFRQGSQVSLFPKLTKRNAIFGKPQMARENFVCLLCR